MNSQNVIRAPLTKYPVISEKSLSISGVKHIDTKVVPIPPDFLETMSWPRDLVLRLMYVDHTDRKNGDYRTYVGLLSKLDDRCGVVRDISHDFCLKVKIVANEGESNWVEFDGNFNCRPFEDFDEVGPIGWEDFSLLMFCEATDQS